MSLSDADFAALLASIQGSALGSTEAQPALACRHWIGPEWRYCDSIDSVRNYLPGMRCPAHTPAALAGRPEAPTPTGAPWWIRDGKPIPPAPASTAFDRAAVASGRRVSGARRRAAHDGEAYDNAQATR